MRMKDKGYTIKEVSGVEKIEVNWTGPNDTGYTEIVVHHLDDTGVQSFDEEGLTDYIRGLHTAADAARAVTKANGA